MKDYAISIQEAIEKLSKESPKPFTLVMSHGTMSVEYFSPKIKDTQTPHLQDELYIIAEGKGFFIREKERISCQKGDVLFVPAGMKHRFEEFSHDFATWVIFYGPQGGEKESG